VKIEGSITDVKVNLLESDALEKVPSTHSYRSAILAKWSVGWQAAEPDLTEG
jgi:hypothetical protein